MPCPLQGLPISFMAWRGGGWEVHEGTSRVVSLGLPCALTPFAGSQKRYPARRLGIHDQHVHARVSSCLALDSDPLQRLGMRSCGGTQGDGRCMRGPAGWSSGACHVPCSPSQRQQLLVVCPGRRHDDSPRPTYTFSTQVRRHDPQSVADACACLCNHSLSCQLLFG